MTVTNSYFFSDKMGFKSKLLNLKEYAVNSMIYNTYYNDDLDEKLVYLESRDGLDFTGNIFRIVEELSTGDYGDLKIYVHAKPHVVDKIKDYQKNYNLHIDKIITKEAMATRILEKAKYIFTDSGIRPKYVKKEGQIFINTWHGTPLKLMGKYNTPEEYRLGNSQHPLLSSDYLLYPNQYMKEKMIKSYMIDKIYSGKILMEGYPRNSVFLKESWLKEKLDLSDYDIFVYMPTFRGILMDRDDDIQKNDVESYLSELDIKLKDNQILFAKLHVLNGANIDFDKFNHIEPFPEGYEVYDVLNMADVLITDYSSVFFDFANTHRKIILFNYDEDDYVSYRDFYLSLSELPFPKVQTVDELYHELNSPINYDDNEFFNTYCTYDNPNAANNICRHIFKDEKVCKEESIENKNPNILIYAGSFDDPAVYSSLMEMIKELNREDFNFFITFKQWDEYISINHEEIFKQIPEDIGVLPLRFDLTPTIKEKIAYDKYFSSKQSDFPALLEKLFKRSFEKQFGNVKWDKLIDFCVNDLNEALMFSKCGIVNDILIRSMDEKDIPQNILKEICKNNNVYVVSQDLIKSLSLCND